MKTPQTNATKGSASKLSGNPTSTGATISEYLVLIYLALEYLLHDDPRHVEYRKARKQAEQEGGTLYEGHRPTPRSPPPSNVRKARYETYPPFPSPASKPPPPDPSGKTGYHECYVRPEAKRSRADTTSCTAPSKQQMSEAWGRMRAVRRSSGRNVHWGSVRVNEYEQVLYESPPESQNGAVGDREVVRDEGNDTSRGRGEVGYGRVEPEVWDAVPNEGEIWGSVGSDM